MIQSDLNRPNFMLTLRKISLNKLVMFKNLDIPGCSGIKMQVNNIFFHI